MKSINPATEETIREYPEHNPAEVARLLATAGDAFARWRRAPFKERGALMHRLAANLRSKHDELSRLMTLEMGKPIGSAEAELQKCAVTLDWFADHAQRLLETQTIASDATRSYVRYEPLGAVLAIMPWNFPFWQVFRFAAPALFAGNVGLLKHASNVPQCALAIEEIFCRAGFDDGVFQTLLVEPEQVEKLIVDARVKAVTLTAATKLEAW